MPTKKIEKVPEDRMMVVEGELRRVGATTVESQPDGQGTFTVIATLPDSGEGKQE